MPTSNNEQLQLVKGWWKQYGYYILLAILMVALANFGWHYWQRRQSFRLEQAATIYMQLLDASLQQKHPEAKLFGEKLTKDYAKSPYASLAALILAKAAVAEHNLQRAQEQLQFVIKNAPSKKIRQIARIRAARILIALQQYQEAINLLNIVDDKGYSYEINEIVGDALLALGRTAEAKAAYHNAKRPDANRMAPSPLLDMKMRQL